MTTHPPAPASSTVVIWQPLCSPSAHHLCGGITAGLPVSISVILEYPLSPPPASESRTARRPSGSTMASSSILSAIGIQFTGFTGFPRPSGSALVCCRPSVASGLHSSGCDSSLCVRRKAPTSLQLQLGPLSLRLNCALTHRHSASGSSTSGFSASVAQPPGVVSPSSPMALPSVGSTVGHLYGCGLGPTWLRLPRAPPVSTWSTLAPPVSSLTPPSIISTINSVCRLPPECPSSSRPSSQVLTLGEGGAKYHTPGPVWLCVLSPCARRDPVSPLFDCINLVQVCLINYPCLVLYIKCCLFLVSFVRCYVYLHMLSVSPACLV